MILPATPASPSPVSAEEQGSMVNLVFSIWQFVAAHSSELCLKAGDLMSLSTFGRHHQ